MLPTAPPGARRRPDDRWCRVPPNRRHRARV